MDNGNDAAAAATGRDLGMGAPVRFPKTAELIADEIRKQIVRGELREGDYLPLEGDLKVSLGVSRPTLREAFRILEAEKLISVVRGSRTGARVHPPAASAVSRYAGYVLQSQGTTIQDIYDSRLAIEPFCAWRIARARDQGAADKLEAEAVRLRALVEEKRYIDFAVGLAEFHRLVVELAGNRTLLLITDMLQDIVAAHQVEQIRAHQLDEAAQRKRSLWGLRSFDRLIALIRAGNAEDAAAHWRIHLVNARRSWVPLEDRGRLLNVLG